MSATKHLTALLNNVEHECAALRARVAELEAALAKPAWERQFHWSDHVPGNCEVCNCDQDAEPCREHVCPGCAELMRGLEYAHDQIRIQRDRLREVLERIANGDDNDDVEIAVAALKENA